MKFFSSIAARLATEGGRQPSPPTEGGTSPRFEFLNRHEHRAQVARRRRGLKRRDSVTVLSTALARQVKAENEGRTWGRPEPLSRNEARRRLKAEVRRRYGRDEAKAIGARLIPARLA